jgi:hypothetical protein
MRRRNPFGYNLIEEGMNRWTFVELSEDAPVSILCADFTSIVLHAVIRMGVPIEEIEEAVKEMCQNNHDAANFGMNGTFIYTFNSNESLKKKAV